MSTTAFLDRTQLFGDWPAGLLTKLLDVALLKHACRLWSRHADETDPDWAGDGRRHPKSLEALSTKAKFKEAARVDAPAEIKTERT